MKKQYLATIDVTSYGIYGDMRKMKLKGSDRAETRL